MENRVLDDLVAQLAEKRSPKRRSAAKKLRKLKEVSAGAAILNALEIEVMDARTWETQYQMIMAIGECGYKQALPLLSNLATKSFEATMVYVAIGDAIVRLSIEYENDTRIIFELLETDNEMLANGAFRAMAMLKMIPSEGDINKIIDYVSKKKLDEGIHFWVLAAAPGWRGKKLEEYLSYCINSQRDDIVKAAYLAREHKYKKWNPL